MGLFSTDRNSLVTAGTSGMENAEQPLWLRVVRHLPCGAHVVPPYSLRAGVGLASREETAELNAGAREGVELFEQPASAFGNGLGRLAEQESVRLLRRTSVMRHQSANISVIHRLDLLLRRP